MLMPSKVSVGLNGYSDITVFLPFSENLIKVYSQSKSLLT